MSAADKIEAARALIEPRPDQIRVKKTPGCWHPYRATAKGHGPYGWGNTAAEARAKLIDNIRKAAQ